ncbi:MAG: hypothetical protein QOK15_3321, partial [Nocardioidaceae bacterium]|nr:hypothetical protein [Nocardioidaceae bacterium]
MRALLGRRRAVIAGAITAVALSVWPALAGPTGRVGVINARDVAGKSPYAGRHCNIPTDGWVASGGVEAEPTVAVDPTDNKHVVAAWMDPTRSSINTAFSRDGGRTWHRSPPRGVDACGGNHTEDWEASGDVWLSFDGQGDVYLSTLAWAHFQTAPTSQYVSVVYALRSTDAG